MADCLFDEVAEDWLAAFAPYGNHGTSVPQAIVPCPVNAGEKYLTGPMDLDFAFALFDDGELQLSPMGIASVLNPSNPIFVGNAIVLDSSVPDLVNPVTLKPRCSVSRQWGPAGGEPRGVVVCWRAGGGSPDVWAQSVQYSVATSSVSPPDIVTLSTVGDGQDLTVAGGANGPVDVPFVQVLPTGIILFVYPSSGPSWKTGYATIGLSGEVALTGAWGTATLAPPSGTIDAAYYLGSGTPPAGYINVDQVLLVDETAQEWAVLRISITAALASVRWDLGAWTSYAPGRSTSMWEFPDFPAQRVSAFGVDGAGVVTKFNYLLDALGNQNLDFTQTDIAPTCKVTDAPSLTEGAAFVVGAVTDDQAAGFGDSGDFVFPAPGLHGQRGIDLTSSFNADSAQGIARMFFGNTNTYRLYGLLGSLSSLRLVMLQLSSAALSLQCCGGGIPLRQRQRTDGLGVGASRVRAGANRPTSRQRSLRQRGYS